MERTAIVTGASGGIGRAIATDLATDHDVIVQYHRSREIALDVVESIEANNGHAAAIHCNVADPSSVSDLVATINDSFGGVDVLVNAAGILHTADLETTSPDIIDQTVSVNLVGALYCAWAVLPGMIDRQRGWIVNVSSTAGIHGSSSDVAYGATKGGLIGATKSLAKQFTEKGIFTNAVAPGPTDTPMYAEHRREATRSKSPIGRLIAPEEVADAVRFFVETESVTGEVLAIDGGLHL